MKRPFSVWLSFFVKTGNAAATTCQTALPIATRVAVCLYLAGTAFAADWENLPPWAASPPWPDKIELDSPDPVTGKGEIYETWAYTQAFAKRFSNLPLENANEDMPPGLQAVAFRIYKRPQGAGWVTTTPIYWCQIDAYVDSNIKLPDRRPLAAHVKIAPERTKTGNSLNRLTAVNQADGNLIEKQRQLSFGEAFQPVPVIFLDGLLDGRSIIVNAEFRADALQNLNLLTLDAGIFCTIVWPKRAGQRYILSVSGNDPYQKQQVSEDARKTPDPNISGGTLIDRRRLQLIRSGTAYHWKPEDSERGLFALPDDLVSRMLNKALAVKTLNQCIEMEEGIAKGRYRKMSDEIKENITAGCQSLRQTGRVYDAFDRKFEYSDSYENRRSRPENVFKN